jgi:MarR family transcriptional regulator, 2-MHQ and catechol-resistance regulon repressor
MDDAASRDRALKLWIVLSRSYGAIQRRLVESLATSSLTEGEFGVMEALLHKGPLLLGELQKKILVSSGGVTYLVDRLVQRGWVRREPCPTDRRAMYAVLTRQGEELIREIFSQHAVAIERAEAGLTAEEQSVAIELLKKLGHAAAATEPEPARKRRAGGKAPASTSR